MIELNIAQVIGYSVQVLLIVALLVALSIRSWPFLIAIVFMGMIALALACVRASNTKSTTLIQTSNFAATTTQELTSGHRELDETHDDYNSIDIMPDPPQDIDSLDNVRPVNLALQGKEVMSQSNRRQLSNMDQSASQSDSRLNTRRAPLMSAVHSKQEKRNPFAYHQPNEFSGSKLYATHMANMRQEAPERAAHFSGMEAGQRYSPEKHAYYQLHKQQTQLDTPREDPSQLHNTVFTNLGQSNEYGRTHPGYVRQYTSPYAKSAYTTTPADLEAQNREMRWTHQSAQNMYGMPFASHKLLTQLGVSNWSKPDPNLVPVNPTSRSRVPDIMRPKLSPWATASYLHRK
jgi:hypothetical protein